MRKNNLNEKYTDEELADSFVFRSKLTPTQRAEANAELNAKRKELRQTMKDNQNVVSIEILKSLEPEIKNLISDPSIWKTLDVDYFPPRVERLYTDYKGYRIFLHTIHTTDKPCLFHKHRWPAAFKQVSGSYEMGITYSENEISSEEAHSLPIIARFIINEGSYYEMTQTDCLHFVKPIGNISRSIMITKDMYPESSFRKEALDVKLNELTYQRKLEILKEFAYDVEI